MEGAGCPGQLGFWRGGWRGCGLQGGSGAPRGCERWNHPSWIYGTARKGLQGLRRASTTPSTQPGWDQLCSPRSLSSRIAPLRCCAPGRAGQMKIRVTSSLQSILVLCSQPLRQLPTKTRAAEGRVTSTHSQDRGAQITRGQKKPLWGYSPLRKACLWHDVLQEGTKGRLSAATPHRGLLAAVVCARCCLLTPAGFEVPEQRCSYSPCRLAILEGEPSLSGLFFLRKTRVLEAFCSGLETIESAGISRFWKFQFFPPGAGGSANTNWLGV